MTEQPQSPENADAAAEPQLQPDTPPPFPPDAAPASAEPATAVQAAAAPVAPTQPAVAPAQPLVAPGQQAASADAAAFPPPSRPAAGDYGAGAHDRPEVPVAAAFAGGLAFALILRRLAR